MWLVYVRDWFHGLLDRAACYWIARPSRRLADEIERWMHDNAGRE